MKALISLVIVVSFLFSNFSCEDCQGFSPGKKQHCKQYTPIEGKQHCCYTKYKLVMGDKIDYYYQCDSFSDEEIAQKSKTISEIRESGVLIEDFDCNLDSGEDEDEVTQGEEEDESSSKFIYLSESVFILLLFSL